MPTPEFTTQRLSIGKAGPTGHGKKSYASGSTQEAIPKGSTIRNPVLSIILCGTPLGRSNPLDLATTFCRFCARRFVQISIHSAIMFNAGRGHALGRGRGRGLGHPPPPMYGLGPPPPFPPPYAIPAGAFQQRNHDGERVNGSKVPNFRDLADNATLSEREHWLDHVFTELAACGSGIRMCFQNRRQLQCVNHDQNYDADVRLHQHFENVDVVAPFSVYNDFARGSTTCLKRCAEIRNKPIGFFLLSRRRSGELP